MADPRDDRVCAAYRELPGEAPSTAVDLAIQAAARRAVGAKPAAARRWQVPLSIAAVLALAIGVSLQVEREKPMVADGTPVSSGSAEYPVPQEAPEKADRAAPAPPPAAIAPAAPPPAATAQALSVRQAPPDLAKQAVPAPAAREESPAAEAKRSAPEPAPVAPSAPAAAPLVAPAVQPASPPVPAAAVAPPAPPAGAGAATADALRAAPQPAPRAKSELAREATTQEKAMAEALESPERRLERIAQLRARGLHEEADRALAEFRRAYPDYRLSEEWRRRVQRP
jgi:hypothetical protein